MTGEGWRAELELGFARTAARTVLVRRRHRGPLTVQRPFYPEGGTCHVYLLHPPGGVVAGDRLDVRVTAGTDAEALLTTPAAGKFYRSDGREARQSVLLNLGKGAALEWLPQETLVYEGARLGSDLRVELDWDARFVGWEILALGRPAAGEGFAAGEVDLRWRIERAGQPLYLERQRLNPRTFTATWGLRGHAACGTLYACPASERDREAVWDLIGDRPGRGVTLLDELLVCRVLTHGTEDLRQFFQQVWTSLRPAVIGRSACLPRIWAT